MSDLTPSLSARSFTCEADSSAETYKTFRSLASEFEVCKSIVDFPIPGSPDNKTSEPSTIPPPKTLSNSLSPVEILESSLPTISFKDKAIIYGALGYFITPIDIVPDILPLIGLSDDIAVLAWAFSRVKRNVTDMTSMFQL